MNLVPSIVGPFSDGTRSGDARAARPLGPIIDIEPLNGDVASEAAQQTIRTYARSGERQQGLPPRAQRPHAFEARPAGNLGFAAQQIAQEVLSEGLYFENYRPALAAYAAADTNFAHVRQPPPSQLVIWA